MQEIVDFISNFNATKLLDYKSGTQFVLSIASTVYEDINLAWEAGDWQFQVFMVEIALLLVIAVLITLAWKIYGKQILEILSTEETDLNQEDIAKKVN